MYLAHGCKRGILKSPPCYIMSGVQPALAQCALTSTQEYVHFLRFSKQCKQTLMFRKANCQHGMSVMDQLCCGCKWLVPP